MSFLQEYACSLPQVGDNDDDVAFDEHEEKYRNIERSVLLLQRLRSQMDAKVYLRSARDMLGKANVFPLEAGRRRPFQVAFMLKALCMANLLRHDGSFQRVLEQGLELVMPEVLRPSYRVLLQESKRSVPHASTISRWRLLLDGAYMLQQKAQNSKADVIRYVMTDASTQHRRELEHILVRAIAVCDLPKLLQAAQKLEQLWSLGG